MQKHLCCAVLCFVAQSCPTLCDPTDCSPPGSSVHGILQARTLEWVATPSSRGICPIQELNRGLLHCRQILYCLSHQGSPRLLEWVADPFSRGSSQPRNQKGVSCILYLREGNGNLLQYSCLENPMDRRAWRATVHGVTKSWT